MRIYVFLIFVLVSIEFAAAQNLSDDEDSKGNQKTDSTMLKNRKLTLSDGSSLIGNIISYNDSIITFKTLTNIEMKIPRANIVKIEKMSGEIIEGSFRRYDPNRTRLFFAPTARPLENGEGYLSVCEIFFPMISFGVTKYAIISGGMSILPLAKNQVFYANIKVIPVQTESFHFAIGSLLGSVVDYQGNVFYGVGTYGNNSNSISFGMGIGYSESEFAENPIEMIGFDLRLSNSIKIVSENWLSSEVQVFSLGIRFFGDNLAGDFGLVTFHELLEGDGFPFFPWLGFAYNFGR